MKEMITWNGEKWIVDYKTHTIYQAATILEDDPTRFTIHARIWNIPFLVFNDSIYFKNGEKEFQRLRRRKELQKFNIFPNCIDWNSMIKLNHKQVGSDYD